MTEPCPFCGSTMLFAETPHDTTSGEWRVCCYDCGAKGPKVGGFKAATEAWNDRKPPIEPL